MMQDEFELKRQLEYKCKHAGCRFEIVNEKYTTKLARVAVKLTATVRKVEQVCE